MDERHAATSHPVGGFRAIRLLLQHPEGCISWETSRLGRAATEQLVYVIWTPSMGPRMLATASKHALGTCASISTPSAESPAPVPVHLETHAHTINLSTARSACTGRPSKRRATCRLLSGPCKSCSPLQQVSPSSNNTHEVEMRDRG